MGTVKVVASTDLGDDFNYNGVQPGKLNIARATNGKTGLMRFATDAEIAAGTSLLAVDAAHLLSTTSGFATKATQIKGGGLATGGGTLASDVTLTVSASSNSDAVIGTATDSAMTPASTSAAIRALLGKIVAGDGYRITGTAPTLKIESTLGLNIRPLLT